MTILSIVLGPLVAVGIYFVVEYLLPDKHLLELSLRVGVPRKRIESRRKWESRVIGGLRELADASGAFVSESIRIGSFKKTSERSAIHSLPMDHPLAIRMQKAMGIYKEQ